MPVNPKVTLNQRTGKRTVKWINGSTANNFSAYEPDIAMAVASITIVAGVVGVATLTLNVSNGGAAATPLLDVGGNAISAAGTYEISTAAESIQPLLSGGAADDWSVFLTYWG